MRKYKMTQDKIEWEKLRKHLRKDLDVKSLEIFGILYNFLYKNVGTGKALYVEPIMDVCPEIFIVLDKYFDLHVSVDKENQTKIIFLKSEKLKDPKEARPLEDFKK